MKVDQGNASGFFQRNQLNTSLNVRSFATQEKNLGTQSVVGES